MADVFAHYQYVPVPASMALFFVQEFSPMYVGDFQVCSGGWSVSLPHGIASSTATVFHSWLHIDVYVNIHSTGLCLRTFILPGEITQGSEAILPRQPAGRLFHFARWALLFVWIPRAFPYWLGRGTRIHTVITVFKPAPRRERLSDGSIHFGFIIIVILLLTVFTIWGRRLQIKSWISIHIGWGSVSHSRVFWEIVFLVCFAGRFFDAVTCYCVSTARGVRGHMPINSCFISRPKTSLLLFLYQFFKL